MMNHTCLCLSSRSWTSFTDPGGVEGCVDLGGWLHTQINVPHRELYPDTVTHPSIHVPIRLNVG